MNSLRYLLTVPIAAQGLEFAPRGRACPYSRSTLVSWELCRDSGPGRGRRTVRPSGGVRDAISFIMFQCRVTKAAPKRGPGTQQLLSTCE